MKKQIIFTMLLACSSLFSIAQNDFHNLSLTYDLTAVYPEDSSVIQFVDIDQDGQNDIKINSWFGHNSGTFSVIEIVTANPNYVSGLVINQCGYMKECSEDNSSINSPSGYVYNTEENNCVTLEGEKSFSFSFLASDGIHQGALYVGFIGNTITIHGVGYNSTPNQSYFCEYSLGLSELSINESGPVVYYNLLGQEVTEKKGVLIEVSSSGRKTRKYFE